MERNKSFQNIDSKYLNWKMEDLAMSNGLHRLLLVHSVEALNMCHKKLDSCLKNYHNKSEQ